MLFICEHIFDGMGISCLHVCVGLILINLNAFRRQYIHIHIFCDMKFIHMKSVNHLWPNDVSSMYVRMLYNNIILTFEETIE